MDQITIFDEMYKTFKFKKSKRILGECYRDKCLPQILLMENVPDVIGNKNYSDFMKWYASLEACGYQSYYSVLNAKNYGVPQNRDRCFMVSILGDYNYTFPKPFELKLRLKDMLEDKVDEKYYISDSKIKYMKETSFVSSSYKQVVHNEVAIPEATKKGYALAGDGDYVNLSYMDSTTRRGRVGKEVSQTLLCNDNNGVVVQANKLYLGVSKRFDAGTLKELPRTLKANKHDAGVVENNLRIRKLTPRECGRLMGVSDENITKMLEVNSNSQCYKQFGNSIVVDVLYYIFKQMC